MHERRTTGVGEGCDRRKAAGRSVFIVHVQGERQFCLSGVCGQAMECGERGSSEFGRRLSAAAAAFHPACATVTRKSIRLQNGTVTCVRQRCPSVNTCPVATQAPGTCCRQCKTCSYLGQTYNNDEYWGSSQDACRTLSCKVRLM